MNLGTILLSGGDVIFKNFLSTKGTAYPKIPLICHLVSVTTARLASVHARGSIVRKIMEFGVTGVESEALRRCTVQEACGWGNRGLRFGAFS